MCLAAARLGEQKLFDDGIAKLQSVARSDWAKSNIAFLQGFNSRLKGNLPRAEIFFRDSFSLSPGNVSAARELAAICLARDNLDEAERFAREARSHVRTVSEFCLPPTSSPPHSATSPVQAPPNARMIEGIPHDATDLRSERLSLALNHPPLNTAHS